ncbi:putative endoplasmic reticulum mannosyl-oligosaccharide 1,2-alpha-mannosidase [Aspergillus flavus AF70]|nr:putative endoplasmic reticulum mannosyl-oligosaccharide 1,2-alpha-mannosidase [Aspergillus flavus AF70]
MYCVANDPVYRKWGWEIFEAFKKHTVVKDGKGCTSLHDVTKLATPQCDNMESLWLGETLKYLYFLFLSKRIPPAHPSGFQHGGPCSTTV